MTIQQRMKKYAELDANTKLIPLSQGKFAIVDADDFEKLSQLKWHYSNGYAVKHGKPKIIMHRIVCNTPDGMHTDHINGNRLDNRKCNLRVCTKNENAKNTSKRKNSTSKYKGVSWETRTKRWFCQIEVNKKSFFLGRFSSEEAAAEAYNEAALIHHGEFARLNQTLGKAGV